MNYDCRCSALHRFTALLTCHTTELLFCHADVALIFQLQPVAVVSGKSAVNHIVH